MMSPRAALLARSLRESAAGVFGALFAAQFTYPIDFVKTRLQVPGSPYTGTLDGFERIIREEGFLTLYHGFSSEILKASLQNALYFFSYTFLKENALSAQMQKVARPSQLSVAVNLAVGMIAGCITQTFTNPLSVVQTRMMTASSTSSTLLGTTGAILKQEGAGALFRGLLPSYILTLNPAIQFVVFDRLKAFWIAYLRRRSGGDARLLTDTVVAPNSDGGGGKLSHGAGTCEDKTPADVTPSALSLFVMGAIAKAIATVVTYPYIMAKVRLQWKPSPGQEAPAVLYKGTLDVIMKILHQEGLLGLFTVRLRGQFPVHRITYQFRDARRACSRSCSSPSSARRCSSWLRRRFSN